MHLHAGTGFDILQFRYADKFQKLFWNGYFFMKLSRVFSTKKEWLKECSRVVKCSIIILFQYKTRIVELMSYLVELMM